MKKLLLILSLLNAVSIVYSTDSTEKKENYSKEQEKLNDDFLKAAKDGNIKKVELLLKVGAFINAQDEDGQTALMLAVRNGHEKIINLLMKQGAIIDIKDKDERTAFNSAVNRRYQKYLEDKNNGFKSIENYFKSVEDELFDQDKIPEEVITFVLLKLKDIITYPEWLDISDNQIRETSNSSAAASLSSCSASTTSSASAITSATASSLSSNSSLK